MAEPRLTQRALSALSTAEPPPQELPLPQPARRRELVARLGLVAADMVAVCSSMLIVAELSGAAFTVWAVALLPLYALLAKAGGLYDRDQFILHKTTLDEAPALLAVAALFTIVIEAVQALEFTGRSHPLLLWGLLGATLLVVLRFREHAGQLSVGMHVHHDDGAPHSGPITLASASASMERSEPSTPTMTGLRWRRSSLIGIQADA